MISTGGPSGIMDHGYDCTCPDCKRFHDWVTYPHSAGCGCILCGPQQAESRAEQNVETDDQQVRILRMAHKIAVDIRASGRLTATRQDSHGEGDMRYTDIERDVEAATVADEAKGGKS